MLSCGGGWDNAFSFLLSIRPWLAHLLLRLLSQRGLLMCHPQPGFLHALSDVPGSGWQEFNVCPASRLSRSTFQVVLQWDGCLLLSAFLWPRECCRLDPEPKHPQLPEYSCLPWENDPCRGFGGLSSHSPAGCCLWIQYFCYLLDLFSETVCLASLWLLLEGVCLQLGVFEHRTSAL